MLFVFLFFSVIVIEQYSHLAIYCYVKRRSFTWTSFSDANTWNIFHIFLTRRVTYLSYPFEFKTDWFQMFFSFWIWSSQGRTEEWWMAKLGSWVPRCSSPASEMLWNMLSLSMRVLCFSHIGIYLDSHCSHKSVGSTGKLWSLAVPSSLERCWL